MSDDDYLILKKMVLPNNQGLTRRFQMALQNGDGADPFDVVKSSMMDFDPLNVMTQSKGLMGDVTAAIVLAAKVVGLVSIDFGNMTSLADTQPLTGRYNLIPGNTEDCYDSASPGNMRCFYLDVAVFFDKLQMKSFYRDREVFKNDFEYLARMSRASLAN